MYVELHVDVHGSWNTSIFGHFGTKHLYHFRFYCSKNNDYQQDQCSLCSLYCSK